MGSDSSNPTQGFYRPARVAPEMIQVSIREFESSDYAALGRIHDLVYPAHPFFRKRAEYEDSCYDGRTRYRMKRFAAESASGQVVGFGEYRHLFFQYHPRKFALDAEVSPEWQGKGVGGVLFERLTEELSRIGAKGERWKAELQMVVNDLGLQDQVSFLGHVSREELRAAYSISSMVLLTSNIEGFGITALEGRMNRKPVVVSKGAGVSELVIDGSNGYSFPSGDDLKAAEAILKTLSAADKLGENGFETSKQCYIGVAVDKEKAILEEAISIYR